MKSYKAYIYISRKLFMKEFYCIYLSLAKIVKEKEIKPQTVITSYPNQ